MSTTRQETRSRGADIAQDDGLAGVPLLKDAAPITGDYDRAIDQALVIFAQDRPNTRVADITVATAGFRLVLGGTGTVLPGGLDVWCDGASVVRAVYHPYDDDDQSQEPMDGNDWRVRRIPGPKTVLEVIDRQLAVADVVRLEYDVPHTVHEDTAASTSILAGDVATFHLLTAVVILRMAAAKAAQNTSTTGLPNDLVDRRTQSDVLKSRAKDFWDQYCLLVGRSTSAAATGGGESVRPASALFDLDVKSETGRGFLWRPSDRR